MSDKSKYDGKKPDEIPAADTSLVLPILSLKSSVLFPEMNMPLVVGRDASLAAVEAASATEDKTLIVASQKNADVESPGLDDLFHIATRAVVKKLGRDQNAVQVLVQGLDRVILMREEATTPCLRARFQIMPEPEDTGPEIEALQRAIFEKAARVMELVNPQAHEGLIQALAQFQDPLKQVYLLATVLPLETAKEQAILAATTRREAMELMFGYLTYEAQVLELRQKITSQAQTEMSREQREYLLRQQLRAIEQELGEKDPEQAQLADLQKRLAEADLPESVREELDRELSRLERIPAASPENQLTRTYLELALELPWKKTTEDNLDLRHARQVLEEDHYNVKEVKNRILEHLAVMKLNPAAKAPILCFVGPPGVGKTSLGQSIARSLGRRFERMSLGGLHDEAELRGHRRTYIGAMPGRIIQAIRRAGVRNPLIMLDEVDKVGRDYRGDPTSALLEILDPAQNVEFRDNYLDLPFDLSSVLFITTANTLDTIPGPLLDRMEVLELSGYSDEEKLQIAKQYLVPRQLIQTGIRPEQVNLPDQTLARVIRRYTREAGVRELERTIGRLYRKAAIRFAQGETDPITIGPEDLTTFLGPERFFHEDARQQLPAGVAAGLAYTPAGGEVLYVESLLLPTENQLQLTGKLGEVMRESAQAARSFISSWSWKLGIDERKLRSGIHIHMPAGATPKDGPSAGVTLVVAMASLLTDAPTRSDTAMTGEITLSGLVLPVGGIKEKVLAAHRAGIRRIILPKLNERDLEEIPEHVRSTLTFVFVERIEEAISAAIPNSSMYAQPVAAGS